MSSFAQFAAIQFTICLLDELFGLNGRGVIAPSDMYSLVRVYHT